MLHPCVTGVFRHEGIAKKMRFAAKWNAFCRKMEYVLPQNGMRFAAKWNGTVMLLPLKTNRTTRERLSGYWLLQLIGHVADELQAHQPYLVLVDVVAKLLDGGLQVVGLLFAE